MDGAYLDFERLFVFTLCSAFFVVRTKKNVVLQGACRRDRQATINALMIGKVALLAALSFTRLHAIEACAIVHAAELIVVGKLNNAKYSSSPEPARVTGRLHIAGLVTGTRPESSQVDYAFDCSDCRELKQQDITFLSKHYGAWFLRKDGADWTSAFPRSTHPGYEPLDTLERYKNCLQGRRFSGRD